MQVIARGRILIQTSLNFVNLIATTHANDPVLWYPGLFQTILQVITNLTWLLGSKHLRLNWNPIQSTQMESDIPDLAALESNLNFDLENNTNLSNKLKSGLSVQSFQIPFLDAHFLRSAACQSQRSTGFTASGGWGGMGGGGGEGTVQHEVVSNA